ncbi:MAG: hypothetical protein HOG49_16555 [Candidatus Scalindua sp.]|jgi:hypothetical protein|nr:hypothetical protein [Candidatus Scalindua sp.]
MNNKIYEIELNTSNICGAELAIVLIGMTTLLFIAVIGCVLTNMKSVNGKHRACGGGRNR